MVTDVTDAMRSAYVLAYERACRPGKSGEWPDPVRAGLEAALAARPEPEGLETTAEEREAYAKAAETELVWPEAGFVERLLRDFDRLLAEIASLKAKLAEAEAEKIEIEAEKTDMGEKLVRAGAAMANILYNTSQNTGLVAGLRDTMKKAQERWDDVRAFVRARGGSHD